MFSHNPIFALSSSVAIQGEQRKNQEQGNIYMDLSVRSCAESGCAQCACVKCSCDFLSHTHTARTHSQHKTSQSSPCKYFIVLGHGSFVVPFVLPLARKGPGAKIGLWLNMRSVCCVFFRIIGLLSQRRLFKHQSLKFTPGSLRWVRLNLPVCELWTYTVCKYLLPVNTSPSSEVNWLFDRFLWTRKVHIS